MLIYEPTFIHDDDIPRFEGVSRRLSGLLYARGLRDEEAVRAFLHPDASQLHDPMLLKDMDRAAQRIRRAIESRERICVYGDYDADGVCATAILADCLARLGGDVFYEIPSRHSDGYGLNIAAVERLAKSGVTLLVTVDNGVKAYPETDRCRELGMDVIVTDHHKCDGRIPGCCAVVCHTRPDDEYPNKDICGAGIAMKLAEALVGREQAMRYIPLAGIATMADVVPLLGENRAIVSLALNMINQGECSEGIKALCRAANDKARILSAWDLSFGIAPRLNAAGRMADAGICVGLLLSGDAKESAAMAAELNRLNTLRRAEEESIIASASDMIEAGDLTDSRCIVLRSPDWNPGVVGIAASRIAERYYRPALLLSERDGMLTGSARSIPGVDLYSCLNDHAGLYTRFGGHAYAAGVTLPEENFSALAAGLELSFKERFSEERFIPRRSYEEEIELSELTLGLAEELELLAPFGECNPEPSFRTDGMTLRGVKRIGSSGAHIKATACKRDRYIGMVAFSEGHRLEELLDMERADAIYTCSVNEWQGRREVQMKALDIRSAPIADAAAYTAGRKDKFIDAFSRNVLYNRGNAQSGGERPSDELSRIMSRGFAGGMALCFTPDGAAELLNTLSQQGLERRVDVLFTANRRQPCAYNCAVLAPELDKLTPSRFREILLYDSRDEGLIDRLRRAAPDARVIPGGEFPDGIYAGLAMDRGRMGRFYRALSQSERRFYNREELADYLCGVTREPRRMAVSAVDIMQELGFISLEGGVELIRGARKRELEESPTYRALARMKGGE